jgi:protein-S-isoprenylcysteine O-methyltransferase Ste14
MKGLEKLKEKLPDYQGIRILKFIIIAIITTISSLIFQLIMDSLPRFFIGVPILQILEPFTPIIGSLIVTIIGFSLVYSFWRNKGKYLTKYGDLAYQKGFKFVITGVPMVITVMIHSFFPNDLLVTYQNTQNIVWFLGTPIPNLIFRFSVIFLYIRIAFCIIFVGLGMLVVLRALQIFGIDYMGLIYVYYPDESTLKDHEIYSILRHPTYHTLMLFFIGSIFLRFSVYSLIFFLIFIIGINLHLKFVEEKELIQRFGEQYKKYKENVPAFLVRLKDLRLYFKILFTKSH